MKETSNLLSNRKSIVPSTSHARKTPAAVTSDNGLSAARDAYKEAKTALEQFIETVWR